MNQTARVGVIGGGPAGIATALRLRQHGFEQITVLESGDYTGIKIGETIQPPCRALLEQLSLWESFLADGHRESSLTGSAWGSADLHFNDFIFRPVGRGWHLNRTQFDRRIAQVAGEHGIVVRQNTRFHRAVRENGGWQLVIQETGRAEETLFCNFVVDAGGRKAVFARSQGAERIQFDELHGCYQFFTAPPTLPEPAGHTLVETVPHGWWYSARLPGAGFVAALMVDRETVRSLQLHRPDSLRHALNDSPHTAARLHGLSPVGPPKVTVANSCLLDRVYGEEWMAAGDAAATFDPASSMGISQALQGGISAADTIRDHLRGDPQAMPRYAEGLRQLFHRYLEVRADYYRMEKRWPHHDFWAHRHQVVHLPPQSRLIAAPAPVRPGLNMYLGVQGHSALRQMCTQARPAHEVIREFQIKHPKLHSDLQVILALQFALKQKQIAIAS